MIPRVIAQKKASVDGCREGSISTLIPPCSAEVPSSEFVDAAKGVLDEVEARSNVGAEVDKLEPNDPEVEVRNRSEGDEVVEHSAVSAPSVECNKVESEARS